MWLLARTARNTPHSWLLRAFKQRSVLTWGMIRLHKCRPACTVMDRTVSEGRKFVYDTFQDTWD